MKIGKFTKLTVFITLVLISCNDKESTTPKQYSVSISVELIEEFAIADEWIHLQITKGPSNNILYDTLAIVKLDGGFSDKINLEPGSYKCFIPDMGAMVQMPIIKLYNGQTVDWGYPAIDAYVFDLPVKH